MIENPSHFSNAMAAKIQECWWSRYCNMMQHIFLQSWWKNRIVTHTFLLLSLPKVPCPGFPHAYSLTLTVTWSVHGAPCQAQLEGSHFFTHHTSRLKLHKNQNISAPISMSCQMGTYPGTACTPHSGSWFIFSASTTSVLTSVLQDEPSYHILQNMDLAAPRLGVEGFFLMMTLKFIPDWTTWQSYLH